MHTCNLFIAMFMVCTMMAGSKQASGQSNSPISGPAYPNKSIRIVTGEPGGGLDFAARLIAPVLSINMGHPVIVDSRAGGFIPGSVVAKAPPDGYTVLLFGSSIWLSSFMQDNVPFDPIRDFSPITIVTSAPNVLVVHPSVPVKTVKELITAARARPGELNFASAAPASSPRMAAELFKSMTGIDIVRINYKGSGVALTDLIAGQVQLMFASGGSVTPHIKSGRLNALGVTSAQPSVLFPGVPSIAASGVPDYDYTAAYGVFAPAKTPDALVRRLNQEIVRVLAGADVRDRFIRGGVEPVGSTPEQLSAKIKYDMARLGKMIKELGLRAD